MKDLIVMHLTREEKIQIVRNLNWDYNVEPEEILSMIDGAKKKAGVFHRKGFFIRCLERMPWHRISALWGPEEAERMLTLETIHMVRSKSRREQLGQLEKILRGKALPPAEWNTDLRKKIEHTVLSNRWYRSQQGVL